MQTKKLSVCTYHINIVKNILKKINSIKKSTLLGISIVSLLLFIFFTIIADFYETLNNASNKNAAISEFKLDINRLSETAGIIEEERQSNYTYKTNLFGSDGNIIDNNGLSSDLITALVKIGDSNNDKNISSEELKTLKIMKLKPDAFRSELKNLQYNLQSPDCNLNNYVVITQGKYAGTILYNGPIKFVDNDNKRYFGLELYN
ncbi:hypothetical protein [Clostridium chromiireducens]|uniref:EF-hand domain-containing protein n=1 Tax=Clostridium chromiireducens TaxID=225345 RepID=A0A1V4I3Y0_9CLOT|nr:hypothetical protein [Clostridium chromiireducens]OPJ54584.1 hypothetical protein CLCHR_48300 [Clostridium chromiireducens]RII33631.1 hypothetical protein D2A34_18060 [Clostridium chromiireducens]